MSLDADDLKEHLNGVPEEDEDMLERLLEAATRHVESVLGFKIDDEDEFPDGAPADVEQAILMVAAHYYENREAILVGVNAIALPVGVDDILSNHRIYTFG